MVLCEQGVCGAMLRAEGERRTKEEEKEEEKERARARETDGGWVGEREGER